jgi:hypothetical protein
MGAQHFLSHRQATLRNFQFQKNLKKNLKIFFAAAAKMPRRGVPQCKSIHLKKKLQKICRRQIAAPLLNNCASMQNY